jgi:hypothetical protein
MNINSYQKFIEAVRSTKILRARKNYLFTFGNTRLPYVMVANSLINAGSSIIRTGEVVVEKPQIIIANDSSAFEGFDIDRSLVDLDQVKFALMSRGISFPQMNYKNSTQFLEVVSDKLEVIIERQMNQFEDANDSRVGLIQCREDTWNLSLLHYVLTQVIRSSTSNMQEYLERYPLG